MEDLIVVVDAYSQIYRGYYAIPGLVNSKGQPTNAIFAFAKFLLGLERDYPSSYGSVVFDLGKPEKRLKIIPEYKATRPPMPEDLRTQLPAIREWIQASGWPILEKEGLEADDVIAALALHFKDFEVRIVSADKDLSQIIDDRIKMLVPDKKSGGFLLRGTGEVIAKFAVKPSQIIDYLSLIGDSSDNIRGIDGIGPKTAAKLMSQFGSISTMLEGISEIENERIREKIRSSTDTLLKNKEIIKLETDLPEKDWNNIVILRKTKPDYHKLKELALNLEMKSLVKDVEEHEKGGRKEKEHAASTPTFYTPDLF